MLNFPTFLLLHQRLVWTQVLQQRIKLSVATSLRKRESYLLSKCVLSFGGRRASPKPRCIVPCREPSTSCASPFLMPPTTTSLGGRGGAAGELLVLPHHARPGRRSTRWGCRGSGKTAPKPFSLPAPPDHLPRVHPLHCPFVKLYVCWGNWGVGFPLRLVLLAVFRAGSREQCFLTNGKEGKEQLPTLLLSASLSGS